MMVLVNVIVWGFIVVWGVILNLQLLKPVRVWFRKQLINNPFLFGVVIVFGGTLIAFGLLFYNNLYPLIKSLYGLIPEDEFGDIKVDNDGFRNISLLIAGSATFSFAVLGMFLSVIRSILTRHQNSISQQGQITESMGRAIEQIGAFNDGKPNIEVRIGGLYSLQFIMQDSPRHAEVIANIFSTYVREHTKKDKDKESKKVVIRKSFQEVLDQDKAHHPREDIRAVFEIISQFNKNYKKQGKGFYPNIEINFSGSDFSRYLFAKTNLSGAILAEVDFSDAKLYDVNFSNATLLMADFSNAVLADTNLHKAMLTAARLPNANLFNADLSSAQLGGADLSGASFLGTDLKNTDLSGVVLYGANLSGAKNLTQEQVNDIVYGDKDTKLPKGLKGKDYWKNHKKT